MKVYTTGQTQEIQLVEKMVSHFVSYIMGESENKIIPFYITKKGKVTTRKTDNEIVIDANMRLNCYNYANELVDKQTDTIKNRIVSSLSHIDYRKIST